MINIIGKRYWFFLISALIIIPGLISLILPPHLNLGNDFHSGTTMTLTFTPAVTESAVRTAMTTAGYADAEIQYSKNDQQYFVSIRVISPDEETKLKTDLQTALSSTPNIVSLDSMSAGPASEAAQKAIIAIIIAAVCIMIYISFSFRKMPRPFRWGICAVIALLHDVLVVVGIFSILGRVMGVKIDQLFITGVLTVAGYSVHDTIVVFDRIRENLHKDLKGALANIFNKSINEVLSRTIVTSLTAFLAALSLFVFGGEVIHDFAFALVVGISVGTYSSVFVASPIVVILEEKAGKNKA